MCRHWFRQVGKGNTREFCKQACRARFYYKQDPTKQRSRMRRRYHANPERFKEYRRNYYQDVQKHPHVHKNRIVTWKVVELPWLPISFSPNFSGIGDPHGMLADLELRHLLADFENEEGELCSETKEDVTRHRNRNLPHPRPHHVPVDLDGGSGLPGCSDSRTQLQFRGHSECWPDAPPAG